MERPDETVKLLLRLDEPMHRLAEAKHSVRSVNGEIVWRLRKSLEQQPAEPVHALMQ